jgi:hypothetical protein
MVMSKPLLTNSDLRLIIYGSSVMGACIVAVVIGSYLFRVLLGV